jgi:hypothetical protein
VSAHRRPCLCAQELGLYQSTWRTVCTHSVNTDADCNDNTTLKVFKPGNPLARGLLLRKLILGGEELMVPGVPP